MSILVDCRLSQPKMRVGIPQLLLPSSYFAAALKGLQTLSEVRKYVNYILNPDQYVDGLRKAGLPE
jgi:hypothetical protein